VGVPERVDAVGLPAKTHTPIIRDPERDAIEAVLAVEPPHGRQAHRAFREATIGLQRTKDHRGVRRRMLASDRAEQLALGIGQLACVADVAASLRLQAVETALLEAVVP